MAIVNAVASGNYSNLAVTFGGVVPAPGDTVRNNGLTIYIDIDVLGVLFQATTGSGTFAIRQQEIDGNGGAINLEDCDFNATLAALNHCVIFSHMSGVVTARDFFTDGGASLVAAGSLNGSGFLIARNCNILDTRLNGRGFLAASGTASFLSVTGGFGVNSIGILQSGAATVNATNVTHGSGSGSHGLQQTGSGVSNLTNAFGGAISGGSAAAIAAVNTGAGTINIENAYSGNLNASPAASNTGTGFLYVGNAHGNDYGPNGHNFESHAVIGGTATASARTFVKRIFCGRFGALPIRGTVFLQPATDNVFQFRESPDGPTKTLVDSSIAGDVPAESDVRDGVQYNNGDNVGSCAVPLPNQTAFGVPVDATVGTAAVDQAALLAAIADALGASGDYALALTATEDGDAVRGVKITLAGSTRYAFTDDDGAAALNLTAGEHVLIVTPPGDYAPVASISLTIDPGDASPISVPIALTRVSVAPPAAGNICRVTLRVADEADAPWVDLPVFATLVSGPGVGLTLHANRGEPALTDAEGIATLDRLQGQVYDITAQRPDGVEITIRRQLPATANADLSTLTVPS